MPETTKQRTILVVDDDRAIRHVLASSLGEFGYQVSCAASVAECLAQLDIAVPDLLLLDVNLPDGSGIEALRQVRSISQTLPIMLITGETGSDLAIRASSLGAREYLTKPLDLAEITGKVAAIFATKPDSNGQEHGAAIYPLECSDAFIGRSPVMQDVFKNIGRVANRAVSVLICGESGTGKELVARALWKHSNRANRTFMAVNCAAMSNSLLESELFGHEKGAFTGADRIHVGKFEACGDGILFLDEVGDMQPAMQAKLLRILQDRKFTRVGGSAELHSDARIIAATNRDLDTMCEMGQFRTDLFHRLNGYKIELPPLRERGSDWRILLSHYLFRYNQRLNKMIESICPEAADSLQRYDWPGNVREVESLLSQAMLNTEGTVVRIQDFPSYVRHNAPSGRRKSIPKANEEIAAVSGEFERRVTELVNSNSNDLYGKTQEYMERYLLSRVLESTRGNQSAAAKRLGITRGSLRFKLKQLGLTIDNKVTIPGRPK